MATNSWAQATDVAGFTGVTVTDAQVMQAQAVIDMFSARTYEAVARIGTRDLYWLKLATSYQAVWMLSQPDMYSRLDFATITMGSRPVQLKDDSLRISPLAAKALKRCSWLRSRSLHVRAPFTDGLSPISSDPDSSGNDAYELWTGLGS
jgi:hypothetical protein